MLHAALLALMLVAPQRQSAVRESEAPTFTITGALYEPAERSRREDPGARGEEARPRPLAGFRLGVGLHIDGRIVAEHEVETGIDGRFRARLPVIEEQGLTPCSFVRVREPGYRQRYALGPLGDVGETLEVEAPSVVPGFTTYVQVSADGAPVVGAQVSTYENDPPLRAGHVRVSRALESGCWALHASEALRTHVFARATKRGAGWLPLALEPEDAGRTHELPLRGDGAIEGVLSAPDGRTLAGVPLTLYPEPFAGDRHPWIATGRRHAALERHGGLCTDTVSTGPGGEFRFEGLLPGRYFVQRAQGRGSRLDIARTLFQTGERDARLVAGRYRILVELVDAGGAPRRRGRALLRAGPR